MRQIVLDTETTGLRVEDGHRIIEIGCVELIDRKLTGSHFHHYINPGREVEAGALAVHGITNEFLQDKPFFPAVVQPFMDYISGAELIIHNAAFDLAFINSELHLTRMGWKVVTDYCAVIDTLLVARQLHPGQRNNLDALCKRYGVDNTKRDMHGALLDAHLLAQVYLAMTGGQGSFFDSPTESHAHSTSNASANAKTTLLHGHRLVVLSATDEEITTHQDYLNAMKKKGKCVWSA